MSAEELVEAIRRRGGSLRSAEPRIGPRASAAVTRWLRDVVAGRRGVLGEVDDEFAKAVRLVRLASLAVEWGAEHPALDDALRTAFVQGVGAQRVSAAFVNLVSDAGIETVTLKGPALAMQILGDPALRASSDVDLLVRREDMPRLRLAFAAAGLLPAGHQPVWYEERWHDHQVFLGLPPPPRMPVEVHWDIVRPGLSRLPVDEVLAEAATVRAPAASLPAPSITWQLVLVAAHSAQHGFDARGLLDVALVARLQDSDGWQTAVRAAERSALGPALYYAAALSAAWLEWEVPDEIERLRPATLRERLLRRWLTRWSPWPGVSWGDLQKAKLMAPIAISGRAGGVPGLLYAVTDRPTVCTALDSAARRLWQSSPADHRT